MKIGTHLLWDIPRGYLFLFFRKSGKKIPTIGLDLEKLRTCAYLDNHFRHSSNSHTASKFGKDDPYEYICRHFWNIPEIQKKKIPTIGWDLEKLRLCGLRKITVMGLPGDIYSQLWYII